ncbi:hypothetical protein JOB18_014359, partial [Solea senegalensis]
DTTDANVYDRCCSSGHPCHLNQSPSMMLSHRSCSLSPHTFHVQNATIQVSKCSC